MKKPVIFALLLFLSALAYGQLIVNVQAGRAFSYSQRAGGLNDKENIKIYPYKDNTFSLGAGYKINTRLALLASVAVNSHSYRLKMREEGVGIDEAGDAYTLEYNYSDYIIQYKLTALYTIFQYKKFRLNGTGSAGAYCPRCSMYGWTGLPNEKITSEPDDENADTYLTLYKGNMKNYTFINSYFDAGIETVINYNKFEIGLFADFQISLRKNFDHRVEFTRKNESGHIDISNRGMLFRAGFFARPVINLKRKPAAK